MGSRRHLVWLLRLVCAILAIAWLAVSTLVRLEYALAETTPESRATRVWLEGVLVLSLAGSGLLMRGVFLIGRPDRVPARRSFAGAVLCMIGWLIVFIS